MPPLLKPLAQKATLLFSLALLSSPLFAQTQPAPAANTNYANRSIEAVPIPKSGRPPVIDGDLSDPIWLTATKAQTFVDPQQSKPVNEQTEVSLLYDAENIYVAYYCHDSKPDGIVARETVRDAQLRNDDFVAVELDPFLTYKFDGYSIFMVNAIGTRSARLSGGRAGKVEWQGDWSAAVKRVADGWTVEMKIPWAILSYPRTRKPVNIGINFRRFHQRTQVLSMWSDIGAQFFSEREGLWKGVDTPVQGWKPRLSFLPYLMPSLSLKDKSEIRSGVDIRYQPTPELTAVATIAPDFATVEGAVEGINFSRSERYVQDHRPFFLEGQDHFDLGRPYQIGRLFYPTRIGSMDTAIKLYGKTDNKTSIGVLSTFDFGNQSNFVMNVRREQGATSGVNFMALQHLEKGADNTVLALVQDYRKGKWGYDTQYIQSLGQGAGGAAWTTALNLQDKNLFATLRYRYVAEDFLDTLGYIPFTNNQGLTAFVDWSNVWRKGYWRGFEVGWNPTWNWDLKGLPFQRNASLFATIESRNDNAYNFFLNGGKYYDDTDFTYSFEFTRNVTNRFRKWGLNFTTGQQANLPYTSYGPQFSFRLGKRLDVIYSAYLQSYQGFSQQHILTMNYEINPFQSFGGRVVIDNSAVNAYLSYRNTGRKGTDFYVIIGDPNAQSFVQRLLFKWVFAV